VPELPEVETIRQDLLPRVVGRTITHIWLSPEAPRLVRRPSSQEFVQGLRGRRIEDISRRGKYLLLPLSDGRTWIVHLRMTGSLLHHRQEEPIDPYTRARFGLDDGWELRFRDLRKLGEMWLVEEPQEVVGKLGPEPLAEDFTPDVLASRLAGRRTSIKALLLDQRALAGLGNIYADEALFFAGIHPLRPAGSLSQEEVLRLYEAIGLVLVQALGDRGTSFRFYVDALGRKGEHQLYIQAFRRTGQPCYRCGSPIQRIKVGGRGTHFCPRCQGAHV